MFLQIWGSMMFVMTPLYVMLVGKMTKGKDWWRNQKRTTYHSYYYASIVFYSAMLI